MSPRVELRNHPRELQRFQLRLAISARFVLLLFLILFARFFYLPRYPSASITTRLLKPTVFQSRPSFPTGD